jgi:carboxymethylenebutenolidase
MENINGTDLDQKVYDLFDDYVHSRINRREFLSQVTRYTISGLSATTILEYLSPNYALASQVAPNDPRLQSEYITYESPKGGGKIKGLLSRPVNHDKKLPGIVVVHENRGLNPYIEDVARRCAVDNYLAFAPDALTPLGGYPGDDDKGREMQAQRDRDAILQDFIAGYQFLKTHPQCNGTVGVVGFCFGGWVANMMAVNLPDLAAAVPFYGMQPAEQDVPKIHAPLLLHYAGLDNRVNEGWPQYEKALKKYHKEYKEYMYPDVNHGFHNDTTPRYDKAAAELAWQRTMEFFKSKLT